MSPWILPLVILIVLLILGSALTRRRSRRDVSQQEHRDGLRRLGFESSRQYRESELWRETKRRYRDSDYPQRCLVCGSHDFNLHHRSYARLGDEQLFDLVPLCRSHHDRLHRLLDSNPKLCVKDTHDYLAFLTGDQKAPSPPSRSKRRKTTTSNGKSNPSGNGKGSRAGTRWTAQEDAMLLRGFDQGTSVEQLADRLHRGVRAVEVRLFKLGRLTLSRWRDDNP